MGTDQQTPLQNPQPTLSPQVPDAIAPVPITTSTVPVNSTSISAPAQQPAPQTPANPQTPDLSYHPQSFGGRLIAPFVNEFGHGSQYIPQADGSLQQVATKATPGNMFKTMLTGALSGLAAAARNPSEANSLGGGLGIGIGGGMEEEQRQDDLARQNAVQNIQMKQKAQQLADQHTTSQGESSLLAQQLMESNLHTFAYSQQLHTQSQEAQDKVFQMGKDSLDRAVADHGEVQGTPNMTWQQLQDYQAKNPSIGHEAQAYITGEAPELDANGNPVKDVLTDPRGNALLDPVTHLPVTAPRTHYTYTLVKPPATHTVTEDDMKRLKKSGVTELSDEGVKSGNTIPGAHWLSLSNKAYQNDLQAASLEAEKAKVQAANATARAETERARGYMDENATAEENKAADKIFGEALQKNGQDPHAAAAWMAKGGDGIRDPKTGQVVPDPKVLAAYQIKASGEANALQAHPNTSTTTEDPTTGNKVTTKENISRIFTGDDQSQSGQAQSGPLSGDPQVDQAVSALRARKVSGNEAIKLINGVVKLNPAQKQTAISLISGGKGTAVPASAIDPKSVGNGSVVQTVDQNGNAAQMSIEDFNSHNKKWPSYPLYITKVGMNPGYKSDTDAMASIPTPTH